MMKALNFEIDRIQLHILDDKKTIVDPLTRQKRESFEKNEACSLGRYLKSLNLPENKANQVVISGHEIKIDVLDDKTAYTVIQPQKYTDGGIEQYCQRVFTSNSEFWISGLKPSFK
jgi:hypothetical protein